MAEVWTFLADVRRRRSRDRRGKIAYALYVVALLSAIYGGPVVVRAVHSVQGAPHATSQTHRLIAALPAGTSALWLVVLLGLARQATWRGPVLVSAADADWMLPTPLPRSRMLGSRLRRSLVTGAIVSAALGLIGALILHGYAVAPLSRLWLPAMVAMVLVMTTGLASSALIERFERGTRLVYAFSPAVAATAVAFAAVAIARAAGVSLRPLEDVILWSGPWGWNSQLVVQAAEQGDTFWPVAGALALATAAAVTALAVSTSSTIPARALRQRAATAAAVGAAVFLGETRDARLGIRERRNAPKSRRRLPMPSRALLAIPWRDATALVRAPAAFAWALLGLGIAGVAFRTAVGHHSARHGLIPIALAMLAAYAAGAQFVEPARLDADDIRRTRWSPYGAAGHARRHAALPLFLLAAFGLVAVAGGAVWLGGSHTLLATVAVVVVAPSVVAAALIGAYRGRVPLELMFGGVDMGFGPTGPLLVIAWYVYGPLAAIAVGELTLAPLVSRWHRHGGLAGPIAGSAVIAVFAIAVLYWWVGNRARSLSQLNAAE